jgi:hypothetical protein
MVILPEPTVAKAKFPEVDLIVKLPESKILLVVNVWEPITEPVIKLATPAVLIDQLLSVIETLDAVESPMVMVLA